MGIRTAIVEQAVMGTKIFAKREQLDWDHDPGAILLKTSPFS
jgi:hypothetical protein